MYCVEVELSYCRIGDDRNLSLQPCALKKIPGFGQNPIADVNRIKRSPRFTVKFASNQSPAVNRSMIFSTTAPLSSGWCLPPRELVHSFFALRQQFPNSLRPVTALQQRPLPAFRRGAKDLRSRRKANQKTLFPKQSKILLIDHDTTAGCDHLLSLKQNLCERSLLRSAKIAFPFRLKMSLTFIPSLFSMILSRSTKRRPSLRARVRPTALLPTAMKPVRAIFRTEFSANG